MQTIEGISKKWDALHVDSVDAVYMGYDSTHPLNFYIGIDPHGNREFFTILNRKPLHLPKSSKSIEIFDGIRKDGTFTILFRLIEPGQKEVFTHLCWDLAEFTRQTDDIETGISNLFSRFRLWQKLMEKGCLDILTDSELKGLYGEITFLKEVALKRYDSMTAVTGWCGSNGTDRDFLYCNLWYEIKTTNPGAESIKISSVEQLDIDDPGRLVWIQAEKTAPTDPTAKSITSLIEDINTLIGNSQTALDLFETSLLKAGYTCHKEYEDIFFALKSIRAFEVSEKFPRIRRADLDIGVMTASYEISTSSMAPYEINLES
jgi:hypothetical protein